MSITVFSCSPAKNSNTNNANTENTSSDGSSVEASAETATDIPFPHETRDFGGATFTVLIDRQWDGNNLDVTDYDMESMNGDVMNDAYYTRNTTVEDTYNIKIQAVHNDDISTFANKTIKSGIDEYDAYIPRLMNAGTFAEKGYAVNLIGTNLTLDAPWWDQNIVKDTSIGGAAYFIAGDIFIKHYDGISMLFFNKKLLSDFGLDNPYNLVNNNQWTIDKFNELVKSDGVTMDLNSDGKMTRDDRYGFNTQADDLPSFVNGSGEKFVSKDANDMPTFTGATEKISNIIDKMLDVYVNYTYDMHRDAYGKEKGSGQLVQFWVFPEGRALFYWGFPRYIELGLRSMEDDFGMLPIPKWDSTQDRYYSTLNNWHSYTYMVPITVADVDKSTYIMDALAYYGKQIIKPAYYDVCLQRKYTRDEESSAMLDIIFSSSFYDLGTVYGLGGYVDALESDIQKNKNPMTTDYDKLQNKINTDLTKLIDQFEANKG